VAEDVFANKLPQFAPFPHVELIPVPRARDCGLDMRSLFQTLGKRQITSILIEGGAAINASVLQAGLADKIYWFVAPKLIGGAGAPSPIGGVGIARMENAALLEDINHEIIGSDILVTGYLQQREGRDVYRTCGRIGID